MPSAEQQYKQHKQSEQQTSHHLLADEFHGCEEY